MAKVFLKPDPVDGRVYPKRGTVTCISKGLVTIHEDRRIVSIPIENILRIEWDADEEPVL